MSSSIESWTSAVLQQLLFVRVLALSCAWACSDGGVQCSSNETQIDEPAAFLACLHWSSAGAKFGVPLTTLCNIRAA